MIRQAALTFFIAVLLLPDTYAAGQGMGAGVKANPRPPRKSDRNVSAPKMQVRDIASAAGLSGTDVHGGIKTKKHILEMTGHGVAIVDFDNDGWRDLLFVNGTRDDAARPAPHRLYRNTGNGRFADVTEGSGLVNYGWGQGVCAGDYDNDGLADLLITYYGHNVLYRNLGGGRFEDITRRTGLPVAGRRWATGCSFLDYDHDGLLDLFVSNYVDFDIAKATPPGSSPFCFWKGVAVFCGPRGFPSGRNALYRNENGKFADVTKSAGIILDGLHYGLGVVSADFDNDGWTDIYVACDSTPSILYHNRGDGTFADVSVEAGTAYGESGQDQGSMGVAAGDYDNNGLFDIVKTNFMDETSTLYKNLGGLFFEDTTYAAGLGIHTDVVGWGVEFFDFDQDGWKDILMANGHIYPELEGAKAGEAYRQSKILYWNLRDGQFHDVSGSAFEARYSSRGMAVGDLDGDGALEAVIVNMNEPPSLFRIDTGRGNALLVELVGTKSNRSGIGARVSVKAGERRLMDEVRSGSSFASQSDLRLHFGLGKAEVIEKLHVQWPSGAKDELTQVPVNQAITIQEGVGITLQRPFGSSEAGSIR
jgi:hypothetical protein